MCASIHVSFIIAEYDEKMQNKYSNLDKKQNVWKMEAILLDLWP